jgi:hypothetical protein
LMGVADTGRVLAVFTKWIRNPPACNAPWS